ncbi:hypothetical protein PCE1_004761 [Barthelona sp. PCE]
MLQNISKTQGRIAVPPKEIDSKVVSDTFNFNYGTTTLAFVFEEGIIVAADSRATQGNLIANRKTKKVLEITPHLLGTMAGGAADCAFWERVLTKRAQLYELQNNERISAKAASKVLADMVYRFKGRGLVMGTMVCGYDNDEPAVYYVEDNGQRIKGKLFSVGSGSTFAYGVLDTEYRYDMNAEEAIELAREAIYRAQHRDAYSGNYINIYHIKPDGWEHVQYTDCTEVMDHYQRD